MSDDTQQTVTVDGRRVYTPGGTQLTGLALAAWFGCDMDTPADPTKASGYEKWRAVREAHEIDFLKRQMERRGK